MKYLITFILILAVDPTWAGCKNCDHHKEKKAEVQPVRKAVVGDMAEAGLSDSEIFNLLLPYQKGRQADSFGFYNVSCSNPKGEAICEMTVTPSDKKTLRLKPSDSEKLFLDILARLPVAKGDSGAQTEYIGCTSWKENGASKHQCTVAIPIQNLPQDRVPTQ